MLSEVRWTRGATGVFAAARLTALDAGSCGPHIGQMTNVTVVEIKSLKPHAKKRRLSCEMYKASSHFARSDTRRPSLPSVHDSRGVGYRRPRSRVGSHETLVWISAELSAESFRA